MAVADDGVDALQCGDFRGRALRITACNNDFGGWIPTPCAPNKGAGGTIRFRCNATGVYNDELGGVESCSLRESAVAQSGGNGFTIRTARAASKVLNVVCFHTIEFSNAG